MPEPRPDVKNWSTVADELDRLQGLANDGRGVSCVRDVVALLRQNNLASAKVRIETDTDKMRNYPDVWKYMLDQGLREKEFFEE